MKIAKRLADGLASLTSQLVNRRNVLSGNKLVATRLSASDLREIWRLGIMRKIVQIKTGAALNDTLKFETTGDEDLYRDRLQKHVKAAAQYMLGFGRGVILVCERNANLREELREGSVGPDTQLRAFSGDLVHAQSAVLDIQSPRYMMPDLYLIRGTAVHHSRVIDFRYMLPAEQDLGAYQYGGIPEPELIYPQLVNDAIVERAAPVILERGSNVVYKIKDFGEMLATGDDAQAVEYFHNLENIRSVFGAVLMDSEDSAEVLNQQLTNLADVDRITLRRLAMVTGIGMSALIGEEANGLGASGDTERDALNDMRGALQSEFLIDPVSELCSLFGIEGVSFRKDQDLTAKETAELENKVVTNAQILYNIGEDASAYLEKHGVIEKESFENLLTPPPDEPESATVPTNGSV